VGWIVDVFGNFDSNSVRQKTDAPSDKTGGVFNPPEEDAVAESLLLELENRKKYPSNLSCDRRPQAPNLAELENTCGIDLTQKYNEVKDSTMKIVNHEGEAVGSGFAACTDDGSVCGVVTNFHVVRIGPADKEFYFLQGDKATKGHVVKKDRENDLALLVPDDEPVKGASGPIVFKPVKFGEAKKNESAFTSCFPTLQLNEPFVNSGKVHDTEARVLVAVGTPMLSPPSIISDQRNIGGCSGGANFNAEGELIGILRADGQEGTVTIKSKHAQNLLRDYKQELAEKQR
jgi:S1-C subfamily serine protease